MKNEKLIIFINIFMVVLVIMMQCKYLKYNYKIKNMISNIYTINDEIEKLNNDKIIIKRSVEQNNKTLEDIRTQLEKIEDNLDATREKLNSL